MNNFISFFLSISTLQVDQTNPEAQKGILLSNSNHVIIRVMDLIFLKQKIGS
jgi:hypothetical protein